MSLAGMSALAWHKRRWDMGDAIYHIISCWLTCKSCRFTASIWLRGTLPTLLSVASEAMIGAGTWIRVTRRNNDPVMRDC